MSIKSVTKQERRCDFCGAEAYDFNACLGCGKDICWQCQEKHGVKYVHGVHFSGSQDGWYCNECDSKLYAANDPLHAAYSKIAYLRREEKAWYDDFEFRKTKAEKELQSILSEKGK